MRTFILLMILLLPCVADATGPHVRFKRYFTEQGLSQSVINVTVQDSDGYLWFGTSDGLFRYDGYQFKAFVPDPDDPGALAGRFVNVLFFDAQDNLWVGTGSGGLNKYDKHSQQFSHLRHDPADPNSLSDHGVLAVVEDNQGWLWIGTMDGLNRYNPKTRELKRFRHLATNPNSLSHDVTKAIIKNPDGTLWIGTFGGGLNKYDPKTQQFSHYRSNPSDPTSLSDDNILKMYKDVNGNLWVGTLDGLNQFDEKTGQFVQYKSQPSNPKSLSNNVIWDIVEDSKGVMWVGTDGGLNQFDRQSRGFVHYSHQASDPDSISTNSVRSVFEDRNNTLWLGTYGGGLNRYNRYNESFLHYKHQQSDPNSLSNNLVMTIFEDSRGELWFGTYGGGLNKYDAASGGFIHYRHHNADPASISSDGISAIYEDSKGRLWVGTIGGGLNRLNAEQQTFVHYRYNEQDPASLSNDAVGVIFEDSTGTLWVGTYGGGLNRYLPQQDSFVRYQYDSLDPHSLSNDNVTVIIEEQKGFLWVATFDGFNHFNPNTGKFVNYKHLPADPDSLTEGIIESGLKDNLNRIWLGTNNGLELFNPQTGKFSHFRQAQGLLSDVIGGILQDENGFIWLSTKQGISRLDLASKSFKHYDVNDGLQGNAFNPVAAIRRADGEMLFGGFNGFNRFYPQQINDKKTVPKLVLTDWLRFNKPVRLPKALAYLDHLTLDYTDTLVSFEFAALNFINPMKMQYAYRLKGLDDNWINTDAQNRRATFTNLPSGDFTLQVKARHKGGLWQDTIRSLAITVTPPWWETWWAYMLYGVMIVAVMYSAYRYRTRSLIERAKSLEQGVKERTATINQLMAQKQRMFANISHEFKTPLTLIINPLTTISQSEAAERFGAKVSMMLRNGQRLLRMVEQLLELSRLETTQSKNIRHYSLAQTLQMLLTQFEALFDSKKLSLNSPPFEDVILSMSEDSLEMILNNLISNAIKYTPDNGNISVEVKRRDDVVDIRVKDSGLGISKQNQKIIFERFTRANETQDESIPGAGIGLALVKELLEANQGTITLQSEKGQGSAFTVTLPVNATSTVEEHDTSRPSSATLTEIELLSQTQAAPQTDVEQTVDTVKPSVLLIDDNADMLELLTQTLSKHYHCYTAQSGESGLTLAKVHLPDMVISDVMMPGISGFELLKKLKQDKLTNHIPVVLLTAKGDVQSRITGWTEQADEYLAKPFNQLELLTRMENLLVVRRLLRQRYQQQFSQTTKHDTKAQENEPASLGTVNQLFVDQVNSKLAQHYSDDTLDVAFLARQLAMSPRQLSRKIKSVLDMTPTECIRAYRLKKATEFLSQGITASVVAFKVGFSSHSYFSQCFKAQYDCLPSNYPHLK